MSSLKNRIKTIQNILQVPQTQEYDLPTLQMLDLILNIIPITNSNTKAAREAIQRQLEFTGKDIDGAFGPQTTLKIETLVAQLPNNSNRQLKTRIKGIQALLEIEETGEYDLNTLKQLDKKLKLNPVSTAVNKANLQRIQTALGFTGNDVDGAFGPKTTFRIEALAHPIKTLYIPSSDMPNAERIKAIQKELKVIETGDFNLQTLNALEDILKMTPRSTADNKETRKKIQRKLGFRGSSVDGIYGSNTITKIENFVFFKMPPIPDGASLIVSQKSVDLIFTSEVSSESAYRREYQYPTVPGASSGVTIGIGYDLGHVTKATFEKDWKRFLDNDDYQLLLKAVGEIQDKAKQILTSVKHISIPYENAIEVFYTTSLSSYAKDTRATYPGLDLLPPDVQGVMLSIVYNRGASVSGDRRREMKNIQAWVKQKNLPKIAEEIRSMKRLWQNDPKTRGLLTRRDNEARLVEQASYYFNPNEIIIV